MIIIRKHVCTEWLVSSSYIRSSLGRDLSKAGMKKRTDYSRSQQIMFAHFASKSHVWSMLQTSCPDFIVKSSWPALVCPPAVPSISHQGSVQQPVTCVWSVGQSVITTDTAAATGLRLIWLMTGQSNLPVFELLYSSRLRAHTHTHTHTHTHRHTHACMHARWQKHTAHIDLQARLQKGYHL